MLSQDVSDFSKMIDQNEQKSPLSFTSLYPKWYTFSILKSFCWLLNGQGEVSFFFLITISITLETLLSGAFLLQTSPAFTQREESNCSAPDDVWAYGWSRCNDTADMELRSPQLRRWIPSVVAGSGSLWRMTGCPSLWEWWCPRRRWWERWNCCPRLPPQEARKTYKRLIIFIWIAPNIKMLKLEWSYQILSNEQKKTGQMTIIDMYTQARTQKCYNIYAIWSDSQVLDVKVKTDD